MNEKIQGQLVFYQTEDGSSRIECHFAGDTLWLSLKQIAELFGRDKSVISRHLKSIFDDEELKRNSVVANHATTAADWVTKLDDFLKLSDHDLLTHAGKISAEQAKEKAELEHDRFHKVIDLQPTQVDRDLEALVEIAKKGDKKK